MSHSRPGERIPVTQMNPVCISSETSLCPRVFLPLALYLLCGTFLFWSVMPRCRCKGWDLNVWSSFFQSSCLKVLVHPKGCSSGFHTSTCIPLAFDLVNSNFNVWIDVHQNSNIFSSMSSVERLSASLYQGSLWSLSWLLVFLHRFIFLFITP